MNVSKLGIAGIDASGISEPVCAIGIKLGLDGCPDSPNVTSLLDTDDWGCMDCPDVFSLLVEDEGWICMEDLDLGSELVDAADIQICPVVSALLAKVEAVWMVRIVIQN